MPTDWRPCAIGASRFQRRTAAAKGVLPPGVLGQQLAHLWQGASPRRSAETMVERSESVHFLEPHLGKNTETILNHGGIPLTVHAR